MALGGGPLFRLARAGAAGRDAAALQAGAEQVLKGMRAESTAERVRALLWFERSLDAASKCREAPRPERA